MCRWMRSHFYGWIDYNGVAFSTELLEWGRKLSGFWEEKCWPVGFKRFAVKKKKKKKKVVSETTVALLI